MRRLVASCALIALASGCTADGASTAPTASPATRTPITTSIATTTTSMAATTQSTFDRTPRTPHERCLERAVFGDPAESPYVLPFPAGAGYTVWQSYCNDDGSHETQLAYDFAMPLGSEVIAARAGFVSSVRSDISDTASTSDLNYVTIRHDDGTVAFYAHLMQDGVLVAVGDTVEQGQPIAFSGSSGRTGEVLHFGVYGTDPPRDEADRAVDFNNAEGVLDERGGLREGAFYRALP